MARADRLPVYGIEQILVADFQIPASVTEKYFGLGNIMLEDALAYCRSNPKIKEADGILGYWKQSNTLYKDYGGQSVNLTQFWNAVREGKTYEQAAFETFTGKWAKKGGFARVVLEYIDSSNPEKIIVKFIK